MHAGSRLHVRTLAPLLALVACRAGPLVEESRRSAPSRPIPLAEVALFLPPVALEAGGEPIDVTRLRGYAGPAVRDDDGDGRPELYVGSFSGQILRFENMGTARAPAFEKGELVRAAGEELRISNW